MKLEVLDNKGKKIEDVTLEKSVFGAKINETLLAQYVHIYRTNQRQGTAASKTRANVSGGGKKPWRQKGTGRARHGSIRSPIWVGGGIAHGPQPRKWRLSLPKKMRTRAMQSILTLKHSASAIKVIDALKTEKPSTAYINQILKTLNLSGKTLVVLSKGDKIVLKSAANVKNVKVSEIGTLNIYELLSSTNVLFEKEALESLQKKYK